MCVDVGGWCVCEGGGGERQGEYRREKELGRWHPQQTSGCN